MGFDIQERLKKAKEALQTKAHCFKKVYKVVVHTYIRAIQDTYNMLLEDKALNPEGTAKSWPHKYLFNAEWESFPRIPFSVQNILLGLVVQF